jgi:hypothetical protein
MSNQVVIPFPQLRNRPVVPGGEARAPEAPYRAKILSRLATARDVVKAVIETLKYVGDARVRPPLPPVTPLPNAK